MKTFLSFGRDLVHYRRISSRNSAQPCRYILLVFSIACHFKFPDRSEYSLKGASRLCFYTELRGWDSRSMRERAVNQDQWSSIKIPCQTSWLSDRTCCVWSPPTYTTDALLQQKLTLSPSSMLMIEIHRDHPQQWRFAHSDWSWWEGMSEAASSVSVPHHLKV